MVDVMEVGGRSYAAQLEMTGHKAEDGLGANTTTIRTRERQLPCTATNINKNYELGGRGEGEFLLFIETWV